MLIDLRYALKQLEQARRCASQLGNLVRPGGVYGPVQSGLVDCHQRCQDALERCLEAAQRQEDDADLAEAQSRGPGWTR